MAAPFTITSVSNYNSNPPSDDGAQTAANRVQWSTQKTKLSDPIKTAFDTSESATSTAFGKVVGGAGITTTALDYTVTASDQGKLVKCTASGKTITTPDATVVGSPFAFFVSNTSTGNITLHGNGSQTVDGSTSVTIPSGCGVFLNTDGANWFTAGQDFNSAGGIINYLSGLTLSTAGSSTTMSIASGSASDSTNIRIMQLLSAYSKTTASWAVGSGNGGLDTGVIANSTWYHWYLIQRTDTGVVDVIFSISASAPTLPTNYTLYRRIGAGKTNGSGQWVSFVQVGDEFLLPSSTADSSTAATSTAALITLASVPTGIKVIALYRADATLTTGGSITVLFTSPDESDQATSLNAPSSMAGQTPSGQVACGGEFRTRTNTSGQIRQRANVALSTTVIETYGWIDRRGKDG